MKDLGNSSRRYNSGEEDYSGGRLGTRVVSGSEYTREDFGSGAGYINGTVPGDRYAGSTGKKNRRAAENPDDYRTNSEDRSDYRSGGPDSDLDYYQYDDPDDDYPDESRNFHSDRDSGQDPDYDSGQDLGQDSKHNPADFDTPAGNTDENLDVPILDREDDSAAYYSYEDEQRARERRIRREKRKLEERNRRNRQIRFRMTVTVCAAAALVCVIGGAGFFILRGGSFGDLFRASAAEESSMEAVSGSDVSASAEIAEMPASNGASGTASENSADANASADVSEDGTDEVSDYQFKETDSTITIPDLSEDTGDPSYVDSKYVVLIDADTNEIVAERDPYEVISPASMTKILTILTARNNLTDDQLNDTFTITQEISDYTYSNGCSVAGFEEGSAIKVEELFYGTILPSGADAAAALAYYTSGSIESFAQLMNEEASKLGISKTAHFDNPVGVYSEDNHCTVTDMAAIMKAAMEDDFCAKVLSAHTYQCTATNQDNPDGILLSNWFLRRIEDKDTGGGTVIAAKTGFVNESGSCAASYYESNSGKHYICVTANAYSSWRAIYDHAAIYKTYAN